METRDDILKELQAIAPTLAGLEKTTLFRLPRDYFAGLQTVLMKRIALG